MAYYVPQDPLLPPSAPYRGPGTSGLPQAFDPRLHRSLNHTPPAARLQSAPHPIVFHSHTLLDDKQQPQLQQYRRPLPLPSPASRGTPSVSPISLGHDTVVSNRHLGSPPPSRGPLPRPQETQLPSTSTAAFPVRNSLNSAKKPLPRPPNQVSPTIAALSSVFANPQAQSLSHAETQTRSHSIHSFSPAQPVAIPSGSGNVTQPAATHKAERSASFTPHWQQYRKRGSQPAPPDSTSPTRRALPTPVPRDPTVPNHAKHLSSTAHKFKNQERALTTPLDPYRDSSGSSDAGSSPRSSRPPLPPRPRPWTDLADVKLPPRDGFGSSSSPKLRLESQVFSADLYIDLARSESPIAERPPVPPRPRAQSLHTSARGRILQPPLPLPPLPLAVAAKTVEPSVNVVVKAESSEIQTSRVTPAPKEPEAEAKWHETQIAKPVVSLSTANAGNAPPSAAEGAPPPSTMKQHDPVSPPSPVSATAPETHITETVQPTYTPTFQRNQPRSPPSSSPPSSLSSPPSFSTYIQQHQTKARQAEPQSMAMRLAALALAEEAAEEERVRQEALQEIDEEVSDETDDDGASSFDLSFPTQVQGRIKIPADAPPILSATPIFGARPRMLPEPNMGSVSKSPAPSPAISISIPVPQINLPEDDDDDDGGDERDQPHDRSPSITISATPSAGAKVQMGGTQPPSGATNGNGTGIALGMQAAGSSLRCSGCKDPIVGRIVSAMGQRWHPVCFKCVKCGELLEHVSSYEHDGLPYCHLDYHESFAPKCFHCKTPIADERFITLDDPALGGQRYYHELHFFCAECGDPFLDPSRSSAAPKGPDGKSLGAPDEDDVGFTVYKGHPYCESCHVRLRLPRCGSGTAPGIRAKPGMGCGKPIREGAVEAIGRRWHHACFTCSSCNKPFEDPTFFQRDERAYCDPCYRIIVKSEL